MKTFTFVMKPLTFTIEANASNALEALQEVLKCDTDDEELLLSYLAREIQDHPTLNGSIVHLEEDLGSFCHVPMHREDCDLRAPVFFPVPVGPGI
jgi:hypothetical protein